MKGSVILLGVCCFITLLAADEGRCGTRSQRSYWEKYRVKPTCMQPKLQLVELPVPDGYEYVDPSVVELHQCSGHRCISIRNKCVATDHTDMKLAVRAYKKNDDHGTCKKIIVQDHHECGCSCTLGPSDCSQTQKFDSMLCKCICIPEQHQKCKTRIAKGDEVMWDSKICECKCDDRNANANACSTGQHFVPDFCRCLVLMSSSSEESNQDSSSSEENGIYSKEWP